MAVTSTITNRNKSGHRGICWHKKSKKWRAKLTVKRKCVLSKDFDTKEEAIDAYQNALKQYFGKLDLKPKTKHERYLSYYYKDNERRKRIVAKSKENHNKNRDKIKIKKKEYHWKIKLETIKAYGGKCVCCKEESSEFLTIDHIKNDGAAHRKEITGKERHGAGIKFYMWLKSKGYPKDNYRLLCYNCNCSRGFFGYCPHEKQLNNFGNNEEKNEA